MSEKIQAIRGMNDTLPTETPLWRYIEKKFSDCVSQYGYQEIRFPLLENTALFSRTIGEGTDIVDKEMYTFDDRNGESITLRPEGTAGCVRACIEHGLVHHQQQKLWYSGPVFRYEKPQKGRYRQFTQFGVEAFGFPGVAIELEMLAICNRLWKELGLSNVVHLQLNTLGTLQERQEYRTQLIAYFRANYALLDEDSIKRLDKNPLRILDSKNPDLKTLIEGAPKLIDAIGENSKTQFNQLCEGLQVLNIPYVINPMLVRGLDYYGGIVFEWVTEFLGSQSAVCAGGRFDILFEKFGGAHTPAIGFAFGVERLILLFEQITKNIELEESPLAYVITTNEAALPQTLQIAETLRDTFKDEVIVVNTLGGSFKSQFKKADKSNARVALILGDDELINKTISIKDLRVTGEQVTIEQKNLLSYLKTFLSNLQNS